MQKQCFAIAGTRVPVAANPLCLLLKDIARDIDLHLRKNQILSEESRQGAC